jgi:antitoxin component YwqK of YwqJK toxin-antitoxin module
MFDSKGRKDGIWEDFLANGKLKQRLIYKNGKLVETTNSTEN